MQQKNPSLVDILDLDVRIDVIDIGASPVDPEVPYESLLARGIAEVIGFEPNTDALAELIETASKYETYLPLAVFNGSLQELKICSAPGMTSLLEPNFGLLNNFYGFGEWGEVIERQKIQTVRLDDVENIKNMDFLKIDIQGGELEVLKNAKKKLESCVVIQTEVEFLPMYHDQPLFSEVEQFLRSENFIFHRFAPIFSRVIQPFPIQKNVFDGLSQDVWTDAIFVKNFATFEKLTLEKLKNVAVILHDMYGSYDLVLRALIAHDNKSGSNYSEKYLGSIQS